MTKLSKSGLRKIERAIACGFVPANGWYGCAEWIKARRQAKRKRGNRD
jgi:hypothetical protein